MHLRMFIPAMTRERATLPRTCRVANMVTTGGPENSCEGFRIRGSDLISFRMAGKRGDGREEDKTPQRTRPGRGIDTSREEEKKRFCRKRREKVEFCGLRLKMLPLNNLGQPRPNGTTVLRYYGKGKLLKPTGRTGGLGG